MGTVELSIALHTVWDAPRDTIVFDTGHQAYPHKLLTGRRDQFPTIRQGGGLSGFLRMEESEYDAFGAGHAGTSLSAALGYAEARDLKGTGGDVVAVIGDSAMTAGMALEAVNHAGELGASVKFILNDNSMSIAGAVGALSYHLARMRSQPLMISLEHRAKELLDHLKLGRKAIIQAAEGLKLGMAHLASPKEGPLFEHLGFTYLGPIDGHNTEDMIEIFRAVKDMKGPVLVHVVTVKGKGVEYA
ncbi:1-deoxy-D-xylulose-5-phosphate synthase, partial [Candidatus Fermentibacteria bacterium]|nr:1-deoxy-D-xylulose-5-phosphate synthase [Candidatus Fermentibacteria bacterium]